MEQMEQARAEAEGRRLLAAAYGSLPGGQAGTDLLDAVRRRHARGRRVRVLVPAGVTAAAAAAAAAVTLLSVAAAPSARAAVTSAVTKTAAGSFRVSIVSTLRDMGGGPAQWRATAAFDPTRRTGVLVAGHLRELYVGSHAYLHLTPPPPGSKPGHDKPWYEQPLQPLQFSSAKAALPWDYNADQILDPRALLHLLKSGATVRDEGPVSGPGWTGTKYIFTVRHPVSIVTSFSATVYIDSSGRIRHLAQTTVFTPEPLRSGGPKVAGVSTLDLNFSDFGTPVRVTAPPASEVENGHGIIIIG